MGLLLIVLKVKTMENVNFGFPYFCCRICGMSQTVIAQLLAEMEKLPSHLHIFSYMFLGISMKQNKNLQRTLIVLMKNRYSSQQYSCVSALLQLSSKSIRTSPGVIIKRKQENIIG